MTPLLKEAMRQHKLGQFDQARQAYRQVLAQSPDNADTLHYLGVLMHRRGESEKGAQLIRKAIKRIPAYVDAHKNLGNVLKESGKLEKAEQCYRKAIGLLPGDADAYSNLCVVLRLQDRVDEAVQAGQDSIAINEENPIAWLNYGNALKGAGMLESAIAAYYRALNFNKELVEAHTGLCHALYRLEKISDAPEAAIDERVHAYREWLKAEPDNPLAKFMLAACAGDGSVSRAPDSVVKNLFDGFAASFDENLALLDYRVPGLIRDHLRQLYGKSKLDLSILDAGCGTGLCAAFLKPLSRSLVGVDLSSGMLERAGRLALYDELIEAELTSYLQQASQKFDLIICADTLCYFGQLESVLNAAGNTLNAGSRFIFTLEKLDSGSSGGYHINTSGRYSHTTEYVRTCLAEALLTVVNITEKVIRNESGEPVHGLFVEAEKAMGSDR